MKDLAESLRIMIEAEVIDGSIASKLYLQAFTAWITDHTLHNVDTDEEMN